VSSIVFNTSKGRVSPQIYKVVSPRSSPKPSPKSSLTLSPPLTACAITTTSVPSRHRSHRWGGDDEGDQEPRAVSPREQPEAGPSDREVHPGSRRCGAAPALRRRGGKRPRRPARVREGHPNRTRAGGSTLTPAKPKVRFHYSSDHPNAEQITQMIFRNF
jgi:hypothetical protein